MSVNPLVSIATTLNATQFNSYANDGAFEAAKGSSGAGGDIYYNTTLGMYRGYSNGAWRTFSSLDETQTFTNKTLTAPTITAPVVTTGTFSQPVVSGLKVNVTTTAIDYTALQTDDVIIVTSNKTITLPAVASSNKKILTIKRVTLVGSVTVDGNASEAIDGAANFTLDFNYESATLICDGVTWHRI